MFVSSRRRHGGHGRRAPLRRALSRTGQKVEAALVLDDIGAAGPQPAIRDPVVDRLEPRVAGSGRARVDAALRARDRRRRRARSRGWVSSCAWRGRSRCASRARWCATASTRSRSRPARELPRGTGADTLAGISEDRLTRFGRAAFASVLAFDSPGYRRQAAVALPDRGRNVLPAWSLALLALGLILPALITACRRRGAGAPPRRAGRPMAALVAGDRTAVRGDGNGRRCRFELVGWLPGSIEEAVSPADASVLRRGARPAARPGALFGALVGRAAAHRAGRRTAAAAFARGGRGGARPAAVGRGAGGMRDQPVHGAAARAGGAPVPARRPVAATPRRALLAAAMVAGALALPVLALLYYGARFDLGAVAAQLCPDGRVSRSPGRCRA